MRKILRASVLLLALCAPAFAGDIPMPPAPEPPRPNATEPAQDAGDIITAMENSLTETLQGVIRSVVALF